MITWHRFWQHHGVPGTHGLLGVYKCTFDFLVFKPSATMAIMLTSYFQDICYVLSRCLTPNDLTRKPSTTENEHTIFRVFFHP